MIPLHRSLRRKVTLWGLGMADWSVLALVGSLCLLVIPNHIPLIIGILLIIAVILKVIQKGKPEDYLRDRCMFTLQQGVWIKDRDRKRNT